MEAIKLTNIALDVFCGLVALVILVCMLTVDFKRDRMNRLFILVVVCNLLTLIMDIGISMWDGNGVAAVYYPLQISHFITFALGPVLLTAFTCYILAFLSKKTNITKPIAYTAYIAVAVCVVDLMLCILNPFTRVYFFMDTGNVYHRQDFFWLSQVFSFICIALNTGIIIAHHKVLTKLELVFLLSYATLPALAVAVHILLYGFSIINFAITFVLLLFYVGIQSEQYKQLKQKELELTKNRIDIMLSQIQPHFLYNALGAIDKLYFENTEAGHEAIIKFSNYLRGNMDSLAQKKRIPFEEELAHVKQYLWLEELRFGSKLQIIYDIRTDAFTLPVLTLQPIAENAVRYGVTKKKGGGSVTIKTEETESSYIIEVSDNGVGFTPDEPPQDKRSHIGIDNVRERLHSMCGGTLTIKSTIGKGTIAVIEIPKGGYDNEYYSG